MLWAAPIIGMLCAIAYWVVPHMAPEVLGWIFRGVTFRIPGDERVLYLTIDDSPSASTPAILEVLSRHHVPATFFIIGSCVLDERDLEAISRSGCALGHHMWTATPSNQLPIAQFRSEFEITSRLLKAYSPCYFRPPSGYGTGKQLSYVKEQGFVAVLGTAYPFDTSIRNPTILRLLVKWLAVPGGIIIMHDGADGAERGRVAVEVLDKVIPKLKRCGYEFRLLPSKTGRENAR